LTPGFEVTLHARIAMPVREPADVFEGAVAGDFIREHANLAVRQKRSRLRTTRRRERHEHDDAQQHQSGKFSIQHKTSEEIDSLVH
jgi:hypothetical protein